MAPNVLSPPTSPVALAMNAWMKSSLGDVCGKGEGQGGSNGGWSTSQKFSVKRELGVVLSLFIRHESHYTWELESLVTDVTPVYWTLFHLKWEKIEEL